MTTKLCLRGVIAIRETKSRKYKNWRVRSVTVNTEKLILRTWKPKMMTSQRKWIQSTSRKVMPNRKLNISSPNAEKSRKKEEMAKLRFLKKIAKYSLMVKSFRRLIKKKTSKYLDLLLTKNWLKSWRRTFQNRSTQESLSFFTVWQIGPRWK